MPSKGNGITLPFKAWDTNANGPKTGDAANFTLRWIKDGVPAAPTNAPAVEVDSVNAPGIYKITLTNTEMNCDVGLICGKSSTANIVIQDILVLTDHGVLPNVVIGNAGAVLTDGTGTGQVKTIGGLVDLVSAPNSAAIAAFQLNLFTGTLAQIKAQFVAALATDTYTVPGQATPSDTASIEVMLAYIYKALIHKITQSSSQFSLFDSTGANVEQKATVSSNGTVVTRGSLITGP